MIIEVTRDNFASEVLESETPVLVDFWGPQCQPCLALMPTVDDLARRYEGQLKVAKVSAPENRRLCLNLKVLNLPTFLFFKGGEEVHRLTGDVTSHDLREKAAQLFE